MIIMVYTRVKSTNTPAALTSDKMYRTKGILSKINPLSAAANRTKTKNDLILSSAGLGSINRQTVELKAGYNAIAIARPIPAPVKRRRALLGSYRLGAAGNNERKELTPSTMNNNANNDTGTRIFHEGMPVRRLPITP